ncbi:MAG: helix-turn-helix domain-containing protein [Balneolaceae bacterium]|nr:helix-turn-helix domain-containing protein [Balneolaceae bacterium]
MPDYYSALSLNFWSMLLLFGALHGYFLAAVFLKKGWGKRNGNSIFAGFLAAISYILTIEFIHEARLMTAFPHLLATSTPFIYLLGPLFYLYVRSVLKRYTVFRRKTLIHFLPFIICILTIIPFYLEPESFKIAYLRQAETGPVDLPSTRAIYYGLALIQNAIYWTLIYKSIKSKKTAFKPLMIKWLSRANWIYGGFLFGYLVVLLIFLFTDFYLREIRYTGYLLLSFSVHAYGYLLIQQSGLIERLDEASKYASTSLDKPEIESLKARLIAFIEEEKPFLNSDLKLEDLAKAINVPSHHLSQVINAEFDSNFNEFINRYRVEAANNMLEDEQFDSYSLEGIALECGFNNRSTFYRVFRKHTGTTPARYKKEATEQ